MAAPPRKRQRVSSFLDLEAAVDSASEEDTDESSDDEGFIQDNEDVLSDQGEHDRESEGDDGDDSDESVPGRRASHRHLTKLYENAAPTDNARDLWKFVPKFLELVKKITDRAGQFPVPSDPSDDSDETDDRRPPSTEEYLYEIGCKLGYEAQATYKILSMAVNPTSPNVLARSVIARSDIPGRIYVEVCSTEAARTLARAIPELRPSRIKWVPHEQRLSILTYGHPTHQPQTWVRIRAPRRGFLKPYVGDLALLVMWKDDNNLALLLIPRVSLYKLSSKIRPPHKLLPLEEVESHQGQSILLDWEGLFHLGNLRFTPEGFLFFRLADVIVSAPTEDALPCMAELMQFLEFPALERSLFISTLKRISLRCLKRHDRVKIVRGPYKDLCGDVLSVLENEVNIYISSQDCEVSVPAHDIVFSFRQGDEVQIHAHEHRGLSGMVLDVKDGMITVESMRHPDGAVQVPSYAVRFYNPLELRTIRLRVRPIPRKMRSEENDESEEDVNPHREFVNKRVVVVKHPIYKGYRGSIVGTNAQGDSWVELDAINFQRLVKIKLHLQQLVLIHNDDTEILGGGHTIRGSTKKNTKMLTLVPNLLPKSEDKATTRESTPMNDIPESSGSATPAWSPASPYVLPGISSDPPVWIQQSVFANIRVQLVEHLAEDTVLEFSNVSGDHVMVRDGMIYRTVHLSQLRPIHPTRKDDLIVITEGAQAGRICKVVTYSKDECAVRDRTVRRLKRGQTDPSIPTTHLACIYPPLK